MTNVWVIRWQSETEGKEGLLRCPGSQTREEIERHARALSTLFPERSFYPQALLTPSHDKADMA